MLTITTLRVLGSAQLSASITLYNDRTKIIMDNQIHNKDAFASMLLTLVPEVIAGLIAIAGLFIIFWASIEIYKLKGFSWRRVLPICIIGNMAVELAIAAAEIVLDWDDFVYIQAAGLILSSTLLLIAALTFIRFVNYAKAATPKS